MTLLRLTRMIAAGVALGFTAAASAQFVNGDFETGDFTGWTQRNTPNGIGAPGRVEIFEVRLGVPSLAARYEVGQASFQPEVQEGIELVQELNLEQNVTYTISYDWAALGRNDPWNAEGGVFSIIVDGRIIASHAVGRIHWQEIPRGTLRATFTPSASGPHEIGARVTRPFITNQVTTPLQYLDNFEIDPPTGTGLSLRVSGACPGTVTVEWRNATPGRTAGLLFAANQGSFTITTGPCAGTQLGLGTQQLQLVRQFNTGSQGEGQMSGLAGVGACGRFLQVVVADGSPCDTSNVGQIP